MTGESDLVTALKRISKVRRADEARRISAEVLEKYEASVKRKRLLRQLEALPSSKPPDAARQKALYESEMKR